MTRRITERLQDMISAIDSIYALLDDKSLAAILLEPHTRAALERYFEILSEASRYVPPEVQDIATDIDWRDVADLGNIIRHAYHRVDTTILWNSYETGELAKLRQTCVAFKQRLET